MSCWVLRPVAGLKERALEDSGRTDISNKRCMAEYKLELFKLLGKIAKHTDHYKTKCPLFRLFYCC